MATIDLANSPAADDDDDISVTSTQEEEAIEDNLYSVDNILDEETHADGRTFYFIKWTGYPPSQWTWEPEENIESPLILEAWEEEKDRVARGEAYPFDHKQLKKQIAAEKNAKKLRDKKRKAKRRRLNSIGSSISKSTTPNTPVESNEAAEYSSIEASEAIDIPGTTPQASEGPDPTQSNVETSEPVEPPEAGFATSWVSQTIDWTRKFPEPDDKPETTPKASEGPDPTQLNVETSELVESLEAGPATSLVSHPSDWNTKNPETPASEYSETTLSIVETSDSTLTVRPQFPGSLGQELSENLQETVIPAVAAGLSPFPGQKPSEPLEELHVDQNKRSPRDYSTSRDSEKNLEEEMVVVSTSRLEKPSSSGYRGTANRLPSRPEDGRRKSIQLGKSGKSGLKKIDTSLSQARPKKDTHNPKSASTKPLQHYTSLSGLRKAELKSRDLADRPPDLSAIGPLLNPSNYKGSRPLPKKRTKVVPSISHETTELGNASDDLATPDGLDIPILDITPVVERPPQNSYADETRLAELEKEKAFLEQRLKQLSAQDEECERNIAAAQSKDITVAEFVPNIPQPPELPRPVKRVSLSAYKAQRSATLVEKCPLKLRATFGTEDIQATTIGLTTTENADTGWAAEIINTSPVAFDSVCLARDFESKAGCLRSRTICEGGVMTADPDGILKLEGVTEYLRLVSAGLLFQHGQVAILIFPARCIDWSFMDSSSAQPASDDTLLRYQAFETQDDTHVAPNKTVFNKLKQIGRLRTPFLKDMISFTFGLKYKTLVPGHNVDNFFFLFPDAGKRLLEYIAEWLQSNCSSSRFFTSERQGSWNAFHSTAGLSGGVILLHEALKPVILSLTGLYSVVMNFPCSIWEVSENYKDGLALTRLFPHGGVIFLTPSFLLSEPRKSYELIHWFKDKSGQSIPGAWKIAGCYNLRQFLLDLALDHATRREALLNSQQGDEVEREAAASGAGLSWKACDIRFQAFNTFTKIVEREQELGCSEAPDNTETDDLSSVVYADKTIKEDDEKRLVEWFAFWSYNNVHRHRKFQVIGSQSPRNSRSSTIEISDVEMHDLISITDETSPAKGHTNSQLFLGQDVEMEDLQAEQPWLIFDGAGDERPPSRSGIITNSSTGHRSVPTSTRFDGTIRREIDIRPGYVPPEDKEVYRNTRVIGGVPLFESPSPAKSVSRSRSMSMNSNASPSRTTSRVQSGAQSSPAEEGELKLTSPNYSLPPPPFLPRSLVSPVRKAQDRSRSQPSTPLAKPAPRTESSSKPASTLTTPIKHSENPQARTETPTKGPPLSFEPTTEWYGRLKASGGGWEHIAVHGWEKAFRNLGFGIKKAAEGKEAGSK